MCLFLVHHIRLSPWPLWRKLAKSLTSTFTFTLAQCFFHFRIWQAISWNWGIILNSWSYNNYKSFLNWPTIMIAAFLKGYSEGSSSIVRHKSCVFLAFTSSKLNPGKKMKHRTGLVICILQKNTPMKLEWHCATRTGFLILNSTEGPQVVWGSLKNWMCALKKKERWSSAFIRFQRLMALQILRNIVL